MIWTEIYQAVIESPIFGLALTGIFWSFGLYVQKKTGQPLLNPLFIAVICIIITLLVLDVPYEHYQGQTTIIPTLLVPVTAFLGLNIYRQRAILKDYFVPVVVGCCMGSITSIVLVVVLCRVFQVEAMIEASLLPKSTTTAIAMGIGTSRGGAQSIVAAGVLIAGNAGAIFAPSFAKMFRIEDPVAEGIAIGTCSHALGTSRAMEIGKIQGAMSSVAICVAGIATSILVLFLPQ